MKQKAILREFRFPDATLIQKADDILNSIERDGTEFLLRGFNEEKRTALKGLRDAFSDLPTDSSFDGVKISATQLKDEYRTSLEGKLRTIFSIFEYNYGKDNSKYKELGRGDLSRFSDDMLIRSSKIIKKTAQKYLAELNGAGLSGAMIDEITLLSENLDKALDAQLEAIIDRDIKADERVIAGNELYRELAKAVTIGKDIWYSKSEARYNDYVIYNTLSGGREE